MYEVKEIHDPIGGCLTKYIIYRPSNYMVAGKSEIAQIVDRAYQETKGEGARILIGSFRFEYEYEIEYEYEFPISNQ